MPNREAVLAAASLIGTIIGAGIFAIPFVFSRSGVWVCLFYFLILGTAVLLIHLFFGEIVLRTKEKRRLIGYTEKYLNKKAKIGVAFSVVLGTIGALLVYIILSGNFLKIIFPSSLSALQFSLILWAILSFFVFHGIKSIAPVELVLNIGFFAVFVLIVLFSFPKIAFSNFVSANFRHLFLPFGVLLFSLIGWNSVPEIESILKEKKELKKVIIFSVLFSICFYFLFGLVISGVTGPNTTQEAFQGLSLVLGTKIMILGGIFGLFAVTTSFLMLASYLKNTMLFDFGLPRTPAFVLACFSPLLLFLIGAREFIWVLALTGTLVGVIEGTTIILIFKNAKKKGERTPEYRLKTSPALIYSTVAVLILGGLSQLVYLLL